MMRKTVGVIGLGHIGLPLALCFCEKEYRVIGVDVDDCKVEKLSLGSTDVCEMYEGEHLQELLKRHLASGHFIPTTRVAVAAWEGCAYIVTVGIPVGRDGSLQEAPLMNAIAQLGKVVKPNDLILVRSTLVPGMMEERVVPLLRETSRMIPGQDFHVAYASERVAEGRAMEEFQSLSVVLAGLTPKCTSIAINLLRDLTIGDIHVTDFRTAEATKVIENVQRDVNIALAQQIAEFALFHQIDVFELIRMANTHPRVQLLNPGVGVGGYCIPNAYFYLEASLPEHLNLSLFKLARAINKTTPHRIVGSLEEQLMAKGKALCQSKIAILGLGMKDGSNDIRQSPALAIAEILLEQGAFVQAFDPTVSPELPYQTASLESCLAGADGLIVATWQEEFTTIDFAGALRLCRNPVIIDLKQRIQPLFEVSQNVAVELTWVV